MNKQTKFNGRKPGPGRPKGSVNKTTAGVKAALTEAFEKMGGVPALIKWGKSKPDEFYKIWAKMLPSDVQLSVTKSLEDYVDESWGDDKT